MVFSSQIFLFWFLPFALGLYYLTPLRGRRLTLTLLSFGFYGWTNPAFAPLMLLQALIDWGAGQVMGEPVPEPERVGPEGARRHRRRRIAMTASIVANLSLLGFFKYFNFGADSWDNVVTALGLQSLRLDLAFRIVLPLGISFYTFQSMSYAVDVYRGDARPMRSFLDYCCYVSMFPQLVAGPIVRFTEVASQLASREHTLDKFARGVAFIAFGLAKKVLLANPCGQAADLAFDSHTLHAADAWLGALAFSLQLYFDFSAYSDLAIGLGLMLGFTFARNFDAPFLATSFIDHWRRWHLSLSTWLRDYLYKPLGGSRKGPLRTYVNVWLVMLLGGLWHGANWTFVLWGALHAFFMTVERLNGKKTLWHRLPIPGQITVTFALNALVRVPFRAPTLESALAYWKAMAGLGDPLPPAQLTSALVRQPYLLTTLAAASVVGFFFPQVWAFTQRLTLPKAALALALLWVSLLVLTTQQYNPFIYFIF